MNKNILIILCIVFSISKITAQSTITKKNQMNKKIEADNIIIDKP